MPEILIQNADTILTMDDQRRELHGCDILIRDGAIAGIGPNLTSAGPVVPARGCVVTPGLVNTHHHLFQTLTRAVPGGQDALLFGWLQTLYPIWSRFGSEEMFVSALTGLADLALSGCTLSSDHLYLFPNGARLDDTIAAAAEIGLRFHPTRGAMSIGVSDGGLPPDALVESEADILTDAIRVIDAFHDASDGSMCRVGIAPCSPFSVSRDLMRDAALLARDKKVMLHTHLAETEDENAYCEKMYGQRPLDFLESVDWLGPDVWLAHGIWFNDEEIARLGQAGVSIAHCPSSNMRLGSGICRVRDLRAAGCPVGLAVDGSASNDSSHMLAELRQTLLLHRVTKGAAGMTVDEVL